MHLPEKKLSHMANTSNRKTNCDITGRVWQLHNQGYIFDFGLSADKSVICLQNNTAVERNSMTVVLIDQLYDHLSHRYKYIHAVETDSGEKGILLLPEIYFQQTRFAG